MRPKVDTRLFEAFKFFRENAGWATPPGKAACALALAKAERAAKEQGIAFEWLPDEAADLSWLEPGETVEEVLGCIAYRPCEQHPGEGTHCRHAEQLASLWGIADPSRENRRVVEAELALEAL